VIASLKRFIPFRRRLYALRERARHYASKLEAARDARAAVREIRRFKAADPSRDVCGILLVEHLGDIIACEPVIRWVRAHYPASRVVWVVKPGYAPLLTAHPGVDAVITVRSLASVASIVRSGVLSMAIDLHVNNKPTGIPGVVHTKAWGNPQVDARSYLHEASLLGAFSKAAGIEELSGAAEMYLPAGTKTVVDRLDLPPRFVAVHTTSNDSARDWPISEWLELVTYVTSECGLAMVEVGLAATLPADQPSVISLCGKLSVVETAEVIRRAGFFIGVDSGPAHMANVWRRPSLILLSRFHGHDWRPYEGFFAEHSNERLLRHPERLSTLPAARVIERLRHDDQWTQFVNEGLSNSALE